MGDVTRLYIVRHAEAEGNIYRRAHGQCDGILMPNGLAQLERLAARFQGITPEAVYASDLYRARRTALAFARPMGLPVRTDERLREIGLGPWEDKPWGWCGREYPQQFPAFMRKLADFRLDGAETLRQVGDRTEAAAREIIARHRGGTAVIVTHGMAIRALLGRLLGVADEHIERIRHVDNASLTLLRVGPDGAAEAETVGEAEYLGELSTLAKQSWWRSQEEKPDIGLWFRPADLRREADELVGRQRETWLRVYGVEAGFDADAALEKTRAMAAADPRCVQFVMDIDKTVGLLLLALHQSPGSMGHIALIELDEAYCGQGLGIQPVGEAVSFYRARGRAALRLYVHRENRRAVRFYEKSGFLKTGEKPASHGTLDIMCRSILPDRELNAVQ
ncbi:MAG: bifunctional histidine phosphatase family protein/GNAT family N-acetyltransferase [Oscillospiraceae bacterium]|nr:bifunctional histidine phosphatase family protein/GNAT family N-acetyltransferase [Oscillospiraceae bacterium]